MHRVMHSVVDKAKNSRGITLYGVMNSSVDIANKQYKPYTV
jgi:hypothetical protein